MGWQEMREFAPSQLNRPPQPPHSSHTLMRAQMHVFGCKPGKKMAFSRTDQTWTASPPGPTDHLQTAGGHMQNTLPTSLIQKEEKHPSF